MSSDDALEKWRRKKGVVGVGWCDEKMKRSEKNQFFENDEFEMQASGCMPIGFLNFEFSKNATKRDDDTIIVPLTHSLR